MEASRRTVEAAVRGSKAVYGLTTGFGKLSTVKIPRESLIDLQKNLVRSHSSGTGPWLSTDLVRAMMLIRANSLARGHSGVRPEVVEVILELLNSELTPAIPQDGSVGASGDLIPLSHLALALIGEGEVFDPGGKLRRSGPAMEEAGMRPLRMLEKEGISLINGTCLMTAYLGVLVSEGWALLKAAERVGALSYDALCGSEESLDPRLHQARNLRHQSDSARALKEFLAGSELVRRSGDYQGQDPYTLRAMPQVFGAVRMGLSWAEEALRGELNASSDNPLVFDGDVISGGNFHGQPLALALDSLAIALSYLGAYSERRMARLLDGSLSGGLPPFLSSTPGLSSGYMLTQYLAAALVAKNAVLASPASVHSLPTSANQEDFNSQGAVAGEKAYRITENLWPILASEALLSSQALDLRRPKKGGKGSEALFAMVRKNVPRLSEDRPPGPEIALLAGELRTFVTA